MKWLDVFNPASKDQYGITLLQFDKMLEICLGGKTKGREELYFVTFLQKLTNVC